MASATLPRATPISSNSPTLHFRFPLPPKQRSKSSVTELPNIPRKHALIAPVLNQVEPTKRIDVLHPPTVPRRTVFLETGDSHNHLQHRCLLMQRREFYRYHSEWQKPIYGSPYDKELYRSNIRNVLKSQISDRDNRKRVAFQNALSESIQLTEKDKYDIESEINKRREKMKFMNQVALENKKIMEERWRNVVTQKRNENREDAMKLLYNPINWSHTLK